MCDRPLFIPLKTEHFEKFENGTKRTEYRVYGPRWNETTCRIGRKATLSHGYGKKRRLYGEVAGFEIVGPEADPAIPKIFPDKTKIAAIHLMIHPF